MKTVVIILGFRRSGSTILTKALGCHSECHGIGEINYFHNEVKNPVSPCGCGEKYYTCNFWNKIINEINEEKNTNVLKSSDEFNVNIGNEITKVRNFPLFLPTIFFNKQYNYKFLRQKINNTFHLYDKLFEHSKSQILIDSTKSIFRALVLASYSKKYKIKFKYIFLVRDGRAVLHSTQKGFYVINQKDGTSELNKVQTKKPEAEVDRWRFTNSLYLLLLNIFRKKNYILVKHEEFCNRPDQVLLEICNFLNIKYESEMLQIGKHENHILGGNSSRINAKEIKADEESWRFKLSKESIRIFNRKANWLNKLLGYYN